MSNGAQYLQKMFSYEFECLELFYEYSGIHRKKLLLKFAIADVSFSNPNNFPEFGDPGK